jgi:hypothetical protein
MVMNESRLSLSFVTIDLLLAPSLVRAHLTANQVEDHKEFSQDYGLRHV